MRRAVRSGLEVLVQDHARRLRGRRLGLLTHAAAVDRRLRHAAELLVAAGARLVALFAPEHGLWGAAPAGAPVADAVDPATGVPVYSLYGPAARPRPEVLAALDALVIDLQDVGARFYTYAWTALAAAAAAGEAGVPVWVLDRPNPVGGVAVEGPLLDPAFASPVGGHPVPIRHGLTLGELLALACAERGVRVELDVVPAAGWRRSMLWEDAGLPFVPPSPAATGPDMCLLYPGTCLLEGVHVSEGRGTPKPFEWLGAPWVDGVRLARALAARGLPGVAFRPVRFVPWTGPFAGQECGGVQVHVLDRRAVRPVALGVHLLDALRRLWPERFAWRPPGPDGRYPVDLLYGGDGLRRALDAGVPAEEVVASWTSGERRFRRARRPYLRYPG